MKNGYKVRKTAQKPLSLKAGRLNGEAWGRAPLKKGPKAIVFNWIKMKF
jgi:hypothetical protein